jgi:hypothetical protein
VRTLARRITPPRISLLFAAPWCAGASAGLAARAVPITAASATDILCKTNERTPRLSSRRIPFPYSFPLTSRYHGAERVQASAVARPTRLAPRLAARDRLSGVD